MRRWLATLLILVSLQGQGSCPPPKPKSFVEIATDGSGSDFPEGYLLQLAKVESGLRPTVKAPTSSATGLFQFTKGTWKVVMEALGVTAESERELLERRKYNAELNNKAIKYLTVQNERYLRRKGVEVTAGNLYLAHFLGVGYAYRVIRSPQRELTGLVPDRVIEANPFMRRMDRGMDLVIWAANKMAARGRT